MTVACALGGVTSAVGGKDTITTEGDMYELCRDTPVS